MDSKTKLNAAFANLRKQGFIARQNFACCGSCAGYEISTYVKDLKPARQAKVKGAITYNRQDGQAAFGRLYIGFGPVGVHGVGDFGLPAEEVGKALVEALTAQGLQVEWNGNPDERVKVTVG